MRILDYPREQSLKSEHVLVIDGVEGTKGISAQNFAAGVQNLLKGDAPPAEMHRMIFRGKNLGTAITDAQKTAIQNGTFEDLYVGDFWTLSGIVWRIVDINYWLNCGDVNFTKNHLVIMPDAQLYTAQMNPTNITTGGYVGSAMYTANLAQAKTQVANAFGAMVLTHRELLCNAVTNGVQTGGSWYDSTVELPSEMQMYGSYIFTAANDGTIIPYIYTINKQQFALFAMVPKFINPHRQNQWLREVVSAANFALVSIIGYANYYSASTSYGVRPCFAIG